MYRCCCWLYRRVQMLNNDFNFNFLFKLLNLILIWFLVSGVYGMVIQMFSMAFWFVQLSYNSLLKGLEIDINVISIFFRTLDLPTSANTNAKCRIMTTSKRNWKSQSDFSSSVSQHLWIYCIIWIRKYIQTPGTIFSQKTMLTTITTWNYGYKKNLFGSSCLLCFTVF